MRRIVFVAGLLLALNDGVAQGAPPQATAETANRPVSLTDYTLTNWSEEQGPFPFGIYAIAQCTVLNCLDGVAFGSYAGTFSSFGRLP